VNVTLDRRRIRLFEERRAGSDASRGDRATRTPHPGPPARHPELVDRAWLQREYVDQRRSFADIARQLGCDASTVGEYLALAGIAARGRSPASMPPELRDREWLAEAYADRSAEAIARELGVGATAVRRAMRKLGVEVDPHRRR
jgi:transposase-like protein